jgi:hypothetical protein
MSGGKLNLAAKDFSCLADIVAGGVSDSLALIEGQIAPVVMNRKSPTEVGKAESIARWFWGKEATSLKRIAVRVRQSGAHQISVEGVKVQVLYA